MEKIELNKIEQGTSFFSLNINDKEVGRMVVSFSPGILEAGYTSISFNERKNGYGKKLIDAAVSYARQNNLKIIAKCGFVAMMFNKFPETYGDIRAHY